ncbi:MAG: methionine gamma-lyase family protein [Clostridia bacterium]
MDNRHIQKHFPVDDDLLRLAGEAELLCGEMFRKIDTAAEENQCRVIRAFRELQVSETHFAPTTGYGYGDRGRDVLDALYAMVFGCEDALVRQSIASGTVAISHAMFANLRPGDEILFATGKPYDTLMGVVGIGRDTPGSMKEYGITHRIVELDGDACPDMTGIREGIRSNTKMVFIQRSRGYQWRNRVEPGHVSAISRLAKGIRKDIIVMVDNCYGEFVLTGEPSDWGADLLAGSLIKNPGGGLCPSGGYIAGNRALVENCTSRLYAPGLGKEVGSSVTDKRLLFQGFYMAPHIVAQSLKGSVFIACLYEMLGYEVLPRYDESRWDIIQLVKFNSEEQLVLFCRGVQEASPVDAHVRPTPWNMPGYDDKVIMAAGTFVSGASIEFSADAPVRSPYIAYMQGGLVYSQVKLGALLALQRMRNGEII